MSKNHDEDKKLIKILEEELEHYVIDFSAEEKKYIDKE
jgi:hypothetical protein